MAMNNYISIDVVDTAVVCKENVYMLKVDINKDDSPVVHASGNIMEILNDIAVLTSALYTQFQAADLNTAHYFRTGFINMTNDPDSPMWKALGNQTGIAFRK